MIKYWHTFQSPIHNLSFDTNRRKVKLHSNTDIIIVQSLVPLWFIRNYHKMSKMYTAELKKGTYWSCRWQSWPSSIILIAYWICCLWCSSCCWRGYSCSGWIPCHSKAWCCSLVIPLIPSLHSVQLESAKLHTFIPVRLLSQNQHSNQLLKNNMSYNVKPIHCLSQINIWYYDKFEHWTEPIKETVWKVMLHFWNTYSPNTVFTELPMLIGVTWRQSWRTVETNYSHRGTQMLIHCPQGLFPFLFLIWQWLLL